MKKKIFISLLLVVSVGIISYLSLSNDTIDNKLDKNISEEKINVIESETTLSLLRDISNLDVMNEIHEYIALVKIDVLMDGSNYNHKVNEYVFPYTPGKATVLKVLKGKIDAKQIDFMRLGGTIPYEQYMKANDKKYRSSELTESERKNTYISQKVHDDIEIEQGKIYLVYMNRYNDIHKENEYQLDAFEYGLREVKIKNNDFTGLEKEIDLSNIQIKNNKTKSFENLEVSISNKVLKELK